MKAGAVITRDKTLYARRNKTVLTKYGNAYPMVANNYRDFC